MPRIDLPRTTLNPKTYRAQLVRRRSYGGIVAAAELRHKGATKHDIMVQLGIGRKHADRLWKAIDKAEGAPEHDSR